MPQFYHPSLRGWSLGEKRIPLQSGRRLPATLARLLMQVHGSSQVSPQRALGNESAWAFAHASGAEASVCFAGVAQLVEHLFCKQVVGGSSPPASSAGDLNCRLSGEHAGAFRVLASFGLRSDAHAQECVPLRSSPKPRHNAELRRRVIQGRPLNGAAAVVRGMRSALSLARAASITISESSESCPSGQREQAVNLPAYAYAGSNPALSTSARLRRASVSISCLGELSSPSAEVNSAEPPPQVSGSLPRNSANETLGTKPPGFGFTGLGRAAFAGVAQLVERQLPLCGELSSPPSEVNSAGAPPQVSGSLPRNSASFRTSAGVAQLVERQLPLCGELSSPPSGVNSAGAPPQVSGSLPRNSASFRTSAGVAQLVERQPSKLNVEGSSPFSRSQFSGSVTLGSRSTDSTCHRILVRWLRGGRLGQPGCQVWPLTKPSRGPERSVLGYVSTGPEARRSQRAKSATVSSVAITHQQPHAHLAQMVEHVLGKDEVTSSILVVGSKP